MIPTKISCSKTLTDIALVIVAELEKAGNRATVTLYRGHLVMLARSLRDTAEGVDMLEQSDRSLDAMSRELAIARADVARLQQELDTERYRHSIAEVTHQQALADSSENVIDLAEHFRREQRGRS